MVPSKESEPLFFSLKYNPTSEEDYLTEDPTFTFDSIRAGTANFDFCLWEDDDNVSFGLSYNFQGANGVKNVCIHFTRYESEDVHYDMIDKCVRANESGDVWFTHVQTNPDYFLVSPFDLNRMPLEGETEPVVYTSLNNGIRNLRPTIFANPKVHTNIDNVKSYVIYDLSSSVEGGIDIGLDFNKDTMNYVSENSDFLLNPLSDTKSYTVTLTNKKSETEQTTAQFVVKAMTCPDGQVPTVFTRTYYQRDKSECYYIVSSADGKKNGNCPASFTDGASNWSDKYTPLNNQATSLVYEFAECLETGDYELHLTNFIGDSREPSMWKEGSYLTITTLSSGDFTGYVVGDFSYTPLYDSANGSQGADYFENVVKITLGPTVCNDDQQVVVLQKYSTQSGSLEGFDILKKNGDNYDVVNTFYGSAMFRSELYDPYYKVFICLDHAEYKVVLRHRSYKGNANYACSGWSVSNSLQNVTYTNLAGEQVTSVHPAFMSIQVLRGNTYNGEASIPAEDIVKTIEGENYAVFTNDRTHTGDNVPETDIYSNYDCHYDILLSLSVADFNILDEGTIYNGNLLTKIIGTQADLKTDCESTNSCTYIKDYTYACYLNKADAESGINAVPCDQYGLQGTGSLEFNNNYSTPDGLAADVVVAITSVVADGYTATYSPATKLVQLHLEPSTRPDCNNVYGVQDSDIAIQGAVGSLTCTVNGVEKVLQPNEDGTYHFDFSSPEPFQCVSAGNSYNVYVIPKCADLDLPPHMSIPETDASYVEKCVSETEAEEVYCVYNPLNMRAEQVKHINTCHQGVFSALHNKPPRGHSYVNVNFDIVATDLEDYNAAPSTRWFKQELEYAISEVSHVPMRDVYVSSIHYNSIDHTNTLTVIVDTAYEYGRDMTLQFVGMSDLVENFIEEINQKLALVYPAYWSKHHLSFSDSDFESLENYCLPHTDEEVDFTYITSEESATSVTLSNVEFESTIIWYYTYHEVEDTEAYTFDGAITHYCKPKYYEAVLMDYTDNTQAQLIDAPWFDVHFVLLIEKQNPRGSNIEVRYSVARSLAAVINNPDAPNFIETFDVNVYMIEGDSPIAPEAVLGDEDYKIYDNTKFYVEVRVRDVAQRDKLYNHLVNDVIINAEDGSINADMESAFLDTMKTIIGEGFRPQNKAVKLLDVHKTN